MHERWEHLLVHLTPSSWSWHDSSGPRTREWSTGPRTTTSVTHESNNFEKDSQIFSIVSPCPSLSQMTFSRQQLARITSEIILDSNIFHILQTVRILDNLYHMRSWNQLIFRVVKTRLLSMQRTRIYLIVGQIILTISLYLCMWRQVSVIFLLWNNNMLKVCKDPKFIRLYKCCYYKFININTPTKHINYHKINILSLSWGLFILLREEHDIYFTIAWNDVAPGSWWRRRRRSGGD